MNQTPSFPYPTDASSILSVAAELNSINTVAEQIGYSTHIDLAPDQVITIGDCTLQAKELILLQRLLKETYPEEYL